MSTPVISITNVSKSYGDFKAVEKLTLEIQEGEVYGLLGPNGAGKSTTMLMLMGLTQPDSGEIRICGIDPTYSPLDVKKMVGYLPEEVGFYEDLTGLENLKYSAQLNGFSYKEGTSKARTLLEKVGLNEAVNKKVRTYSRGMKQRLGLADVLIKNPRLIIMDEPTLGIDPAGVRDFLDLIIELSSEEHITVLFSSHLLHQVQQVCHRVGIIVKGKLLANGPVDELSDHLFKQEGTHIDVKVVHQNIEQLRQSIMAVQHVKDVIAENDTLRISCNDDITHDIANTVISSGAKLQSLIKKTYGLDDIYQRYFQGSLN